MGITINTFASTESVTTKAMSYADMAKKIAALPATAESSPSTSQNTSPATSPRAWTPKFKVYETKKVKPEEASNVNVQEEDVDSQYYGDKSAGGVANGSKAKQLRPDEAKRKAFSVQKRNMQRAGR